MNKETILRKHIERLKGLESFFQTAKLIPLRLNPWESITSPTLFVKNSLATAKSNLGNPTFEPNLTRLEQYQSILTQLAETQPLAEK